MKGFYRLYFVAVDYSIMVFSVAESWAFEGMLVEVDITGVGSRETSLFCAVEGFPLFALCLSLTS